MEHKNQYQGLTKQEVEESKRLYGENILTPPEKASLWSQFLEKFDDPIIKILLVAWGLSMIIAGVHCWGPEAKGFTAFLEPIGIFFAIMLASCVGFFFEVKANRAFEVLNTHLGKKYLITPGFVEMDVIKEELVNQYGKEISQTVDCVILVKNDFTILLEKSIKDKEVIFVESFKDGFNLFLRIKEKDSILLIENDLLN